MADLKLTPREADCLPQVLAFIAWDKAHRRARPFAGLSFFKATSSPRLFTIASRHYPHLLCWQWALLWSFARKGEKRRLFGFYKHGNRWTLLLLWIGHLSYQRQSYDRMAALGPRWADAPVIFPRNVQ